MVGRFQWKAQDEVPMSHRHKLLQPVRHGRLCTIKFKMHCMSASMMTTADLWAMLSVISGVSSLTALVDWRRVQFGPWSDFANQFALNPRVGRGHLCCSASSDTDWKRTLVRLSKSTWTIRRSQNSARLTSRSDSLKVNQLQRCERAEFRVRLLPRHLELWTISLVWQIRWSFKEINP